LPTFTDRRGARQRCGGVPIGLDNDYPAHFVAPLEFVQFPN